MSSSYMPDVKVEIAFNAGYATPAASRVWTDVSSYVELADQIKITRGRSDESGVCDANKVTSLTLDNSDGRFTANRAASPYYPDVKLGRPIRITATPVSTGVASTRFVGYIDEWPVEWDDTDAYAFTQITASSRIARLGFDAELGSLPDEVNTVDGADYYYPMSDPEASVQALNTFGTFCPMLLKGNGTAPTFGVESGLTTSATTAVKFTGGKYLTTVLAAPLTTGTATGMLLEAVVVSDPALTDQGIIELISNPIPDYTTGGENLLLTINGSTVSARLGGVAYTYLLSEAGVNTGAAMHLAVRAYTSGGNKIGELYVNGVLADSVSAADVTGADLMQYLWVGHNVAIGTGSATVSNLLINAPFAGLAARAEAALTGFAGDTASERIVQFGALGNIPAGEINADAGTGAVAAIDTTGRTVIDAMRAVEETERGVLFDGKDNTLQFRGRASRYNPSPAFTLSVSSAHIETGIAPKLDRQGLVNDVRATAADGTVARTTNTTSVDDYGVARDEVTIASTFEDAQQAANWQVNTYGEPAARVPSLAVNFIALHADTALQAALMAADIGTVTATTAMPAQAPASTMEYFIEGIAETIGEELYLFDFNVSPTTGYDVWTCEDATFGAFDEYPIAQ